MTDRDYWIKKLSDYSFQQWVTQPSLFAEDTVKYFPPTGAILELGAGNGQDGKWFASLGYNLTMTDLTDAPSKTDLPKTIKTLVVDMAQPLPFRNESFDVVYSHLGVHYFSLDRTQELFDEIYEILKPDGIFAFLVNSVNDPEMQEGEEIESNFRLVGGIEKRFFDISTTNQLTTKFETVLIDGQGTSHKDKTKGLANLIRFVGKKNK